MPKIIVHAPQGAFDAQTRKQVAAALTTLGVADWPEVAKHGSREKGYFVKFEHEA